MATATAGGAAQPGSPPAPRKSVLGTPRWVAVLFLLPALVLLGALVVYPIGYSITRSLFSADSSHFVWFDNYGEVFTNHDTLTAVKNNAIWVIVAPTVATTLGLIFAVLTERVSWGTAFKLLIFMPMAISMLAAGIIFRLVYEQDPDKGVANAVVVGVHDTFAEASAYPRARPRPNGDLAPSGGGAFTTKAPHEASTPVALPLIGILAKDLPDARPAKPPEQAKEGGKGVTGTVWLDFKPGGGGKPGQVDPGEKALKGVKVEAVKDGKVVASTRTADDGTFSLDTSGPVRLRLPSSNFAEQYAGVDWLGPDLVTPAIIGAYIWMWAGFAMVLIAAGLASVPRELLEAARVDGANEWKVFSRITVPLLAPVLVVVLVTLMINVLKIFDLVYIIAPGSTQADANVLALQLYLESFGSGNNQGVGSAIGVLLLLLVVPVMIFNIVRMRREARR
ncbi:carbohydrate ABC transporter permease [Wenjunlia tyrosinilytica]|uniref:ABC transporter permease n=1 Tax=Wenjunlia tyrosinilytica TaxID=1544741 RepID=A0A917ZVD6_9ACTN|nr:sugar ABC transporter permease [Wenjunlia tyrosinilytica]GGO97415.1 ABC transporter permease [Wenjunlia tyrosinilytica]